MIISAIRGWDRDPVVASCVYDEVRHTLLKDYGIVSTEAENEFNHLFPLRAVDDVIACILCINNATMHIKCKRIGVWIAFSIID